MTFQCRAVAMLCLVVILMQQAHFSYGRPQDSSKTPKSDEAERRQDVELTKETQIGDAKVGGYEIAIWVNCIDWFNCR